MTISSINFQKAQVEFAEKHNFRLNEKEASYWLPKQYRKTNEFLKIQDPKKAYEEQMEVRKQNHSRGFAPKLKDVYWEAVVNLEEHHNLNDVKKVADFIQQKYHLQPCSIAIHRDEGAVKDGVAKYNYHAHLCFLTMENGKSQMRTIGKKALSEMQTEVANLLHMERGQVNSKTVRLNHKQYRQVQADKAQAQVLFTSIANLAIKTNQELEKEFLTLKEQKAIVEAERKKYKEEADHIASEYRSLQALNKTLHTREELDLELKKLRQEYEDRLAKEVEKTNTLNSTVNGLKAQKDYFDKAYNAELEIHQQLQQENKELRAELEKVTKERDYLSEFNSAVLKVIQAMHSDFDINHPIQSLKKIYSDWKTRTQKLSITPQKRSQSDETTHERVTLHDNEQNRSMSVLEQNTTKDKKYKIVIGNKECLMTAQDIHDWLEDYPEDKDSFIKQMSEADRREVFGESTRTAQKQAPTRVDHHFSR